MIVMIQLVMYNAFSWTDKRFVGDNPLNSRLHDVFNPSLTLT